MQHHGTTSKSVKPCVLATWPFSLDAVAEGGRLLQHGNATPIDAVEKAINMVELNPEVESVGYGGFANAAGFKQLDAAIMDGRTHDAGSVCALEGVRTPISVARKVMEFSKHTMLVGEGAKQFALSKGFQEECTITDKMKQHYEQWKATQQSVNPIPAEKGHDTVGLIALNENGDIAVGCSTSGLKYKEVGRVGDSPIIGSGLYVENDVGAATATGDGDEIMKHCLSFLTVQFIAQGMHPQEACDASIKRMVTKHKQSNPSKPLEVAIIALDKSGRYGASVFGFSDFAYTLWTPDEHKLVPLLPQI